MSTSNILDNDVVDRLAKQGGYVHQDDLALTYTMAKSLLEYKR
jgi:hypothetical protein